MNEKLTQLGKLMTECIENFSAGEFIAFSIFLHSYGNMFDKLGCDMIDNREKMMKNDDALTDRFQREMDIWSV